MKNEKLVSVIIPAYNPPLELFADCVKSISSQNYTNLEIIIIDDGSQSDVACEIDKVQAEDKRIRVIHQNNLGEGGARNAGINAAGGDYVMFVDADDQLADGWVDFAVSIAEKYTCDVVAGRVLRFAKSKGTPSLTFECVDINIINDSNMWKVQRDALYFKTELVSNLPVFDPGVCSKLFKRELIGETRFPIGIKLSSDQVINHILISRARKYAITNRHSYYYTINDESVSHIFQPKAVEYMMESMKLVRKTLLDNNDVLQAYYYRVVAKATEGIGYSYFSKKKFLPLSEKIKGIQHASNHELVKEVLSKIDMLKLPNFSSKVRAFLLKYHFCFSFAVLKIITDFLEEKSER